MLCLLVCCCWLIDDGMCCEQNGFFASAGPLEIFVSEKVNSAQPTTHSA